jgi:hypothetical protein
MATTFKVPQASSTAKKLKEKQPKAASPRVTKREGFAHSKAASPRVTKREGLRALQSGFAAIGRCDLAEP